MNETQTQNRPLPALHLQLMTKNLASSYWDQFWKGLIDLGDEVDEIITGKIFILDTGSTDGTLEKVQELPEKIRDKVVGAVYEWNDDFAYMRNLVHSAMVENHPNDAIIWLDSDDEVTAASWRMFNKYFMDCWEKFPEVAASYAVEHPEDEPLSRIELHIPYNYATDENGNVLIRQHRERIVWPMKDWEWRGQLHELLFRKTEFKALSTTFEEAVHGVGVVTHKQKKDARDSRRNWRIALTKWVASGNMQWRELMYSLSESRIHNIEAGLAIAGVTGMLAAKQYETRLNRFGFYDARPEEQPKSLVIHVAAAADCAVETGSLVLAYVEFMAKEAAEAGKSVDRSVCDLVEEVMGVLDVAQELEQHYKKDVMVRPDFMLIREQLRLQAMELFPERMGKEDGEILESNLRSIYNFVPIYNAGCLRSDFVMGGLPRALVTKHRLLIGDVQGAFREHVEAIGCHVPCHQVYHNDLRLRKLIEILNPVIVKLPDDAEEDFLRNDAREIVDKLQKIERFRDRPVWLATNPRALEYALDKSSAITIVTKDFSEDREALQAFMTGWVASNYTLMRWKVFNRQRKELFFCNVFKEKADVDGIGDWGTVLALYEEKVDSARLKFTPRISPGVPPIEGDLVKTPSLSRALCGIPLPRYEERQAAILSPSSLEEWDGHTVWNKGIGGSESCAAFLAESLARYMPVTVFCATPNSRRSVVHRVVGGMSLQGSVNVEYLPTSMFLECSSKFDTIIYSRLWPDRRLARKQIVWLHDMPANMPPSIKADCIDAVVLLSEFHKEEFVKLFPSLASKVHIVSHGVEISNVFRRGRSDLLRKPSLDAQDNLRMLFTPQPERGLDEFCKLVLMARSKFEDESLGRLKRKVEAACIYGSKNFSVSLQRSYEAELKIWQWNNSCDLIAGVKRLGKQRRSAVAYLLHAADVVAYPTSGFKETFCLSALEAVDCGTPVIASEQAGAAAEILRKHAHPDYYRILKSAGPTEDREEWSEALDWANDLRIVVRADKARSTLRNALQVPGKEDARPTWEEAVFADGGWVSIING